MAFLLIILLSFFLFFSFILCDLFQFLLYQISKIQKQKNKNHTQVGICLNKYIYICTWCSIEIIIKTKINKIRKDRTKLLNKQTLTIKQK